MSTKKVHPQLEATDFRNCLNGTLRALNRRVDAIYRKHLRPHGVTEGQFNLLAAIAQERQIEQSELGRMLHMERSTVSRDLRSLLNNGWVRRSGPRNRLSLSITEGGVDVIESLVPHWNAAMEETRQQLGPAHTALYQMIGR